MLAAQTEANQRGSRPMMTLGLHQNTSSAAGYRRSLEGWAKAGIRHVEITAPLVDEFLTGDTLAAAGRVLSDNGLTPVSAAAGTPGIFEPNPSRAAALDVLKRRCEMFASLGLTRIYQPAATTATFTADDFKATSANMHEVGDIASQFKLTFMVEAVRNSTLVATIATALRLTREANHPSFKPLFDCYHFWSGPSKFEDLESARPGEIGHVHFQDVPNIPQELMTQVTREIPGDGVAPLDRILKTLAAKGYAGTLSVELFLPRFQQGDPFEIASEIKRKSEAVMRRAGVLRPPEGAGNQLLRS
jgi:sugar phosphate isomerase/epimerase